MKQSTKLLSLVLALVMAFSFVGVIGNAALAKGDVKYDAFDDAQLTFFTKRVLKYGGKFYETIH